MMSQFVDQSVLKVFEKQRGVLVEMAMQLHPPSERMVQKKAGRLRSCSVPACSSWDYFAQECMQIEALSDSGE